MKGAEVDKSIGPQDGAFKGTVGHGDWWLRQMPQIDYDSHPAYGKCFGKAGLITRLKAQRMFWQSFFFVFVRWLIDYDNLPLLTRHREGRSVRSFARIAVPFMTMLVLVTGRRVIRWLRPSSKIISDDELVATDLYRTGRTTIVLNEAEKRILSKAAEPAFERLRQRRGLEAARKRDFEDSRLRTNRTDDRFLYQTLDNILQQHGILDLASAYLGRVVGVKDVNPQINDRTDDFWRDQFGDIALGNSRTTYVHVDAGYHVMKMIIYMSDVKEENGPFSYILGTNRMETGFVEGMIRRANDYAGLSSTERSSRRLFAALPAVLRMKCALGADIVDDCPDSQRILEREWFMMPSEGDGILFDPFGLHRGGLVTEGERVVLTVILGQTE